MDFYGLQKMTLLDFPGHVAATVFTGGCNFRCPFCHNALLVNVETDVITENEILDFLSKRKGILDGVAITGGEPLMHAEIIPFMQKVRDMGFMIKLDTNGSFPERLKEIVRLRLCDYVAMDIKNCKEKYAETCGLERADIDKISESVDFLIGSGIDFEFRTTVVRNFHSTEDIEKIAQWIGKAPKYFLQNFVDSGALLGENIEGVSKEELEKMRESALKWAKSCEIRGI